MSISISEYFQRQVAIAEIRSEGLQGLQKATVAVVGVGGVGSAASEYLARSGVGHLRLIDQDIVDPTNLHRLHGLSREDIYCPKAETMAKALAKTNPWTVFEPIVETLRESNATTLLGGADVVVDGLDNFRTRYHLNEFSLMTGIPYVFTSAIGTQGHVAFFTPPDTACLECAIPRLAERPQESCEALGITPTTVGLVGAIAASEAVKLLLGLDSTLKGSLLTVDLMGPDFLHTKLRKRGDCPAHQVSRPAELPEAFLTTLCGEKTFNVLPRKPLQLDLLEASQRFPRENILRATGSVLVCRRSESMFSLFRTGRVLVVGAKDKEEAVHVASEVWTSATASLAETL